MKKNVFLFVLTAVVLAVIGLLFSGCLEPLNMHLTLTVRTVSGEREEMNGVLITDPKEPVITWTPNRLRYSQDEAESVSITFRVQLPEKGYYSAYQWFDGKGPMDGRTGRDLVLRHPEIDFSMVGTHEFCVLVTWNNPESGRIEFIVSARHIVEIY